MWKYFSGILLRNKLAFTIGVLLLTVFMGYEASKMQLSYEFAKILPDTDSTFIEYQNFKKKFADKDLFQFEKFKDWTKLNNDLKNIQGVKAIMSLPTAYRLVKNDSLEKFDFVPLIQNPITSQKEVDSLKNEFLNMPFYEGIIYNKEWNQIFYLFKFKKINKINCNHY